MKVSIILPAYNSEKTIEKCLNSIINQTYKFYEIIVVDDGSTDNTSLIVSRIINNNVQDKIILLNNKNHGVSYSRNCGVSIASGDYITFIDSDDYLDNDMLETMIHYLEKKYDFLRYNFKCIGGNAFNNSLYDLSNREIDLSSNKEINSHFLTVKEKIPNLVMLLIIKKEIANKIKFNEALSMMEDVDYYNQLFAISKKGLFIDEKKYNYFVNQESVTHSNKNIEKNIFGIIAANREVVNRCTNIFNNYFIKQINGNHARIIGNYLIDSNYSDKLILRLFDNNLFLDIIKNCSSKNMSLKDKIMICLMKLKNQFLLKKFIKIINKIKGR